MLYQLSRPRTRHWRIDQVLVAGAHQRREQLLVEDKTITGFNVGMNVGASAGQTVFHVHVHLIPRRDGDMENPRGGVGGVVPGKQKY